MKAHEVAFLESVGLKPDDDWAEEALRAYRDTILYKWLELGLAREDLWSAIRQILRAKASQGR